MIALDLLQSAFKFIASRTWGGNKYSQSTFAGDALIAGKLTDYMGLPDQVIEPAQDITSGKFYRMFDYDPMDDPDTLIR